MNILGLIIALAAIFYLIAYADIDPGVLLIIIFIILALNGFFSSSF